MSIYTGLEATIKLLRDRIAQQNADVVAGNKTAAEWHRKYDEAVGVAEDAREDAEVAKIQMGVATRDHSVLACRNMRAEAEIRELAKTVLKATAEIARLTAETAGRRAVCNAAARLSELYQYESSAWATLDDALGKMR